MSRRGHVLIVSPRFPSPAIPTNGVRESRLLEHLPGLGFHPRVVVPVGMRRSRSRGSAASVPIEERSGGAVVAHPRYLAVPGALTSRGYAMGLATRLYRQALRVELNRFHQERGSGVLHAHSCTMAGYSLLALRGAAPLVVTVHDSDVQTTARHPRLYHRVATVLRGASHVVYQSSKLRDLGEGLVGRHSSSVIPWGIETHEGIVRSEPEAFTVTAVARLVPTKGLDLLLRAFRELREDVPEARLEIIGEGPERPRLERLVERLGLKEHATLPGAVDNEDAQRRMAASSVFVLPSYLEALGVVYLEAMSHGVPTVGVRGQGIEDVIEHRANGWLVPPRDVRAIHVAMRTLARDRALARRLGEAGRQTLLSGPFGWERHAEQHAELYRSLLERARVERSA